MRDPPPPSGVTLQDGVGIGVNRMTEYHIHLRAVPESGNCTDTGGHLDSYVRGDSPPCDSSMPQTCEVGDLSGKYGTVAGPDVKKAYVDPDGTLLEGRYVLTETDNRFNDPYTAMNIIQLGYIGNRSVVFHDASSARIACATLKKVEVAVAPRAC